MRLSSLIIILVFKKFTNHSPHSPGNWREQEVPAGHLEQAFPCSYIWPLMKFPAGP